MQVSFFLHGVGLITLEASGRSGRLPSMSRQTSPVVGGILAVLFVLTLALGMLSTTVSPTILLAGVGGIAIFVLSFASTRYALYFLILAALLSPEFGSRATHGGGVTLRLDDFLLLVIGFGQLTKTAVHRDVGLFSWTPLNRYISYYMLACVFATGAGIIFGRVRPLTGFFFVLKYFEYFIVYFMLVSNINTREEAKRFLVLILLTAAIVSFIAIAQIPSGGRVVAPFEGEDGEPNTLGGYLLLIASVVGGLLLCPGAVSKRSHKFALVGLLGLMGVPILFTLSRATWLAVVPAFLTLWLLSERKAILSVGALLLLIAGPFLMPEAVVERALYTVETERTQWAQHQQETFMGITFDTSSSARIRSWKSALSDLPKHPVLGFGVTGWRFIDAQYLRILLETGLAGFTTFLMLQWAIFREARATYRTAKDPLFRGLALGFLAGSVGLIAHALMANTFIIVRIMEPYWMVTAVVIASPELEGGTEGDTPSPDAVPQATGGSVARLAPIRPDTNPASGSA
jgi:O-antigen ligase